MTATTELPPLPAPVFPYGTIVWGVRVKKPNPVYQVLRRLHFLKLGYNYKNKRRKKLKLNKCGRCDRSRIKTLLDSDEYGEYHLKYRSCTVALEYFPYGDNPRIEIASIRSDDRGRGHGTFLLDAVCDALDKYGVKAGLNCSPPYSHMKRVHDWYSRHGFVKPYDEHKLGKRGSEDDELTGWMWRLPHAVAPVYYTI